MCLGSLAPHSFRKYTQEHLGPGALSGGSIRPGRTRRTLVGAQEGLCLSDRSQEGMETSRHCRAWQLWASRASVAGAHSLRGARRSVGGAGAALGSAVWPGAMAKSLDLMLTEWELWEGVPCAHASHVSLQQAGAIKTPVTGTSMPAGKGPAMSVGTHLSRVLLPHRPSLCRHSERKRDREHHRGCPCRHLPVH